MYILTLILTLFFTIEAMATPSILSVKMIWDKALYSAFTDLIYYKSHFFCCFRESNSHQEGENGMIRILRSKNASKWTSVALLSQKGYDLRDPKFSITPDGQLLLNMGATVWNEGQESLSSAVSFSNTGNNWSEIQMLPYSGQWLWHVTWNKNVAYGAAYSYNGDTSSLTLMQSSDGINYSNLKAFDMAKNPTEATLRFMPDDTMIALLRRDDGPGLIGSSPPPYDTWKWVSTHTRLGGPDFLILEDESMWASSRQTVENNDNCILASMSQNSYNPVLKFPSHGDCSYPGMVHRNGKLYVSYYSSQTGKACIYLAIVKL